MQFEQFFLTIAEGEPPVNLNVYLQALWYDAKGRWQQAHALVDQLQDVKACWVHAYLHRKEGDIGNADYWYRRAGKQRLDISLEKEWETIVRALL